MGIDNNNNYKAFNDLYSEQGNFVSKGPITLISDGNFDQFTFEIFQLIGMTKMFYLDMPWCLHIRLVTGSSIKLAGGHPFVPVGMNPYKVRSSCHCEYVKPAAST